MANLNTGESPVQPEQVLPVLVAVAQASLVCTDRYGLKRLQTPSNVYRTSTSFQVRFSPRLTPANTAQAPVNNTTTPATTAQANTAQAPVNTHQAVVNNLQALVNSLHASDNASQAPVDTSQAPMDTSQASVDIVQGPVETSQAPVNALNVSNNGTRAELNAARTKVREWKAANTVVWKAQHAQTKAVQKECDRLEQQVGAQRQQLANLTSERDGWQARSHHYEGQLTNERNDWQARSRQYEGQLASAVNAANGWRARADDLAQRLLHLQEAGPGYFATPANVRNNETALYIRTRAVEADEPAPADEVASTHGSTGASSGADSPHLFIKAEPED